MEVMHYHCQEVLETPMQIARTSVPCNPLQEFRVYKVLSYNAWNQQYVVELNNAIILTTSDTSEAIKEYNSIKGMKF